MIARFKGIFTVIKCALNLSIRRCADAIMMPVHHSAHSLPLPVGHYYTSGSFITEMRYWMHWSLLMYKILKGIKYSALRN